MRTYADIGVQIPQILLPRPGIDLTRWAVIACDQFTSQPEYWAEVERIVGDAPSTLHIILPEVYLGTAGEEQRVSHAQATMRAYLEQGILQPYDGMVYVERTIDSKKRRGLLLALDLERYDYSPGSTSLIRATEGTILERLPPRMRIREGAPLEVPHILVLIDDPDRTVIEPVESARSRLPKLYDFELMLGSGHLTGYGLADPALQENVIQALRHLADPARFRQHYHLDRGQDVLLFAVGDGNHSLATAKAIWEKIKARVGMDHPARFALVEIENLHDEGLEFTPIHRVLFAVKRPLTEALQEAFGKEVSIQPMDRFQAMASAVDRQPGPSQLVGLVTPDGCFLVEFVRPTSNLPVGTLQPFLDAFIKNRGAEKIDYVHGEDVVANLGAQAGNAAFYLPAMPKSDLFKTVILDGVLPRKTFSMGEAKEKRFYMECRQIV